MTILVRMKLLGERAVPCVPLRLRHPKEPLYHQLFRNEYKLVDEVSLLHLQILVDVQVLLPQELLSLLLGPNVDLLLLLLAGDVFFRSSN